MSFLRLGSSPPRCSLGFAAESQLVPVVLLPAALAALLVAALRRARRPDGALALVLLAILVPPMIAACLTDGDEGNRMRFATTPMLVIGLCWLASVARRGCVERP